MRWVVNETQYPPQRVMGGSWGGSGQVEKIMSPPGFEPQTFQPVASHYTKLF